VLPCGLGGDGHASHSGSHVLTSEVLLLLSGGLDSASLAFEIRPEYSLFIDYGQRAALAERDAAGAIADELGINHTSLKIDLSPIGGGLMAGTSALTKAYPSPEWWPYRNQLLVSIAAGWAVTNTHALQDTVDLRIVVGSVNGDGLRHIDGTAAFYRQLDGVISMQEGGIRVSAPALGLSTQELILNTKISESLLAWTHSCHVAVVPCNDCPGCYKRQDVLDALQILQ
jgi:7-cyano-7-deazaguanine synthase